jgi:diguanylate cyclase (GGDEF)-like protein
MIDCLVVPDATEDPRFADNALVTGPPFIRADVGAPIITPDGYAVGSLCAIDDQPREFPKDKLVILSSFADLVMNELELRQVASCDGLTGLANRLSFERVAEKVVQQPKDKALLCLDLDHVKSINDSHGHAVGDDVIKATAGVLHARCPSGGCAARIGGEEFAVLLPDLDTDQAASVAEAIRKDIECAELAERPDIQFTASIGVAYANESQDTKHWMAAADSAVYAAKTAGRNCVGGHEPSGKDGGQRHPLAGRVW